MKVRKCLIFLLVFLLLFSSFAFTSSAAESDLQKDFDDGLMTLTTSLSYYKTGSGHVNLRYFHTNMNGVSDYSEYKYEFSRFSNYNPDFKFGHTFELSYNDGRVLMPAGDSLSFSIHNFYSSFYWGEFDENNFEEHRFTWLDISRYSSFSMYFWDFEGNRYTVSKDMYDIKVNQDDAMITIQMKSDMYDLDVYRLRLFIFFDVSALWCEFGSGGWVDSESWIDVYDSFFCTFGYESLFFEISSEDAATTGLLTSIIDHIKNLPSNIKTAFQSLFDDLTSGISGFFESLKTKLTSLFKGVTDGISNLYYSLAGRGEEGDSDYIPSLWQRIIDGIKGLFVPDEEYMSAYSDKWDGLLSERLGAVYQVSDVLINSWKNVTDVDTQKTINIPKLEIPLPDNNKFVFGPYDVNIVPDGFGFLFNSIRSITSICIVVLVFNGLRKKYDEVVNR